MDSKIRIRMGEIEVEYEGSEQFLKKDLPELLASVSKLYAQNGHPTVAGVSGGRDVHDKHAKQHVKVNFTGTTATIAGKLGAKSGADLIIAAAAHLTLVGGKSEFSRKELLGEVKAASGFYKTSYGKNLTNYLNGRRDAGELVEPKAGHYALSSAKLEQLRTSLAT